MINIIMMVTSSSFVNNKSRTTMKMPFFPVIDPLKSWIRSRHASQNGVSVYCTSQLEEAFKKSVFMMFLPNTGASVCSPCKAVHPNRSCKEGTISLCSGPNTENERTRGVLRKKRGSRRGWRINGEEERGGGGGRGGFRTRWVWRGKRSTGNGTQGKDAWVIYVIGGAHLWVMDDTIPAQCAGWRVRGLIRCVHMS